RLQRVEPTARADREREDHVWGEFLRIAERPPWWQEAEDEPVERCVPAEREQGQGNRTPDQDPRPRAPPVHDERHAGEDERGDAEVQRVHPEIVARRSEERTA